MQKNRLKTVTLKMPPAVGVAATVALVWLAGCQPVGPDYAEPQVAVPAQWVAGGAGPGTPADLSRWWSTMNDPVLTGLMDRAVAGNLDLRVATSRLREARAARGVVAAGNAPVVDGAGSYDRTRASENALNTRTAGTADGQNLFAAGLDASWEIDVFGGVRRGVEAAEAEIQGAEWSRRDLTLSLLAEVALTYSELRTAQQRIYATRGNVETQTRTVELSESRWKTGLDSEVNAAGARSQRAATASLIPLLEAQERQAIFRLSTLIGKHPGALLSELEPSGAIPSAGAPLGVPTDVVRRRPDLRRAERELAAATARIGVATADLYPRFTLNGAVGLSSRYIKNWPEGDSLGWGIGPGVRWNLFDGGAIRGNIAVNEARAEQALAAYESTVLTALREVDSAAIAYTKNQERTAALSEAVSAQQRAVDLANELFAKQLTNFLTVLDSQRRLFELQDQLVISQGDTALSLVALYKALGGGWEGSDAVLDAAVRPGVSSKEPYTLSTLGDGAAMEPPAAGGAVP